MSEEADIWRTTIFIGGGHTSEYVVDRNIE
jgi:hypothetical protein